jgi:hypothetical protein
MYFLAVHKFITFVVLLFSVSAANFVEKGSVAWSYKYYNDLKFNFVK